MFIKTLVATVKTETSKYLLVDEWINKLQDNHKKDYYSVIKKVTDIKILFWVEEIRDKRVNTVSFHMCEIL